MELQPQQMEVSMGQKIPLAILAGVACTLLTSVRGPLAQSADLDTAAIEQATGLKGTVIAEENIFKVSKPRTDVKITVDGWAMPPFMGLGSWAAFTPAHGSAHTMVMGDTVVLEDEVNPAMSAARGVPRWRMARSSATPSAPIRSPRCHGPELPVANGSEKASPTVKLASR
jgi:hypothetical protein